MIKLSALVKKTKANGKHLLTDRETDAYSRKETTNECVCLYVRACESKNKL